MGVVFFIFRLEGIISISAENVIALRYFRFTFYRKRKVSKPNIPYQNYATNFEVPTFIILIREKMYNLSYHYLIQMTQTRLFLIQLLHATKRANSGFK
jgi:hypothetical protein